MMILYSNVKLRFKSFSFLYFQLSCNTNDEWIPKTLTKFGFKIKRVYTINIEISHSTNHSPESLGILTEAKN